MASATEPNLRAEDVRLMREAVEYCIDQGWTDGLPVIPPIREFVDEMLAMTSRDPAEQLLPQKHLNRECTIDLAAINAVMAGCKPEYFPVLLAGLDAFTEMGGGSGLLQSTTGQAQVFVVNGPVRDRIGLNYRENILGPGDRANATIGRAVRLIILNALDIKPHDLDQSTHGTPAKYTFCIGENEEDSPWEPLHVERGFAPEESTVTVQMLRSEMHVEHRSTQVPEEILYTIADSMSYAGGIYEAPPYSTNCGSVVIMCPEHANIIASQGWSKADVRQFLYENYGKKMADLRRFGKIIDLEDQPDEAFIHSARGPDSVLLVVSGAANAGVTTVCPNFSPRNATAKVAE